MSKSVEDFENHQRVIWELYEASKPVKPPTKCAAYINRLTAGMQAKKYKGGKAARIKAQTSRLFEAYFKPLPQ
jgi:hypothetical protein